MKDNVLLLKSFSFAVAIVKLYKGLVDQKEYVISKQILRSGTSIGANAEEANATISRQDFSFKIDLAYKEARETHYWLRLLSASGYIDKPTFETYLKDTEELKRILLAILRTTGRIQA